MNRLTNANEHGKTHANSLYFSETLMESLDAILKIPITIVEAPMGYGKTIAVKEYLKDKDVDVIWVSISNETERDLWKICTEAIEGKLPDSSNDASRLKLLGFPDDEMRVSETIRILNSMKLDRPAVLVLDDYHLINSPSMNRLIEVMAQSNIEGVHWVLITRDTYRGNMDFLMLKGFLSVVSRDKFVFSKNDIVAYFRRCGVLLSEEDAALLYQNTEGWVSALYLYLLRYLNDGIIALPISIYGLVELGIYAPMSEKVKEFLYCVCPLKTFSFEQADFVWGESGTHEIIQELRSKNAFVSYDDQARVFRMHGIFLQFLERVFMRLPDDVKIEKYSKCGDWFSAQGKVYQAVGFYHSAGAGEKIMRILEFDKGSSITIGRWEKLSRIMDAYPDDLFMRYPRAVFILALTAYTVGDPVAYRRYDELLKACFEKESADGVTKGLYEFLRGFSAYNDIEEMAAHYEKAFAFVGTDFDRLSLGRIVCCLGSPSVMMMFYRNSGSLEYEIEMMKTKMPMYTDLTKGSAAGSEYLMEGESRYCAGDFETAKILSYMAEGKAAQAGQSGIVSCAKFLQMRCAIFEGDYESFSVVREGKVPIVEGDTAGEKGLLQMFELCGGFINVLVGQEKLLPLWISDAEGGGRKLYIFAYPIYQVIRGFSMLLSGNYAQLIGTMKALTQEPIYSRHALFLIYAHLLIAAAQCRLRMESQALTSLTTSMDIALPDRVYMPFVELYKHIEPVMDAAARSDKYGEHVSHITYLAGKWHRGVEAILSRQESAGKENGENISLLTPREEELARLVAKGLSNRQIAEKLFLAPSTVKRSLVSVFRKLGVKKRNEVAGRLGSAEVE